MIICFQKQASRSKWLSYNGNLIDRLISFILNLRRKFHTKQYAIANVIAMDEKPIWLDMPSATTVNEAGASSVTIRSTGHEKDRVTECLEGKANEDKLKSFIVFKGGKRDVKRMNEERQLSGKCVICTSANGWMNESLTEEWIQYVVGHLVSSEPSCLGHIQMPHDKWSERSPTTG